MQLVEAAEPVMTSTLPGAVVWSCAHLVSNLRKALRKGTLELLSTLSTSLASTMGRRATSASELHLQRLGRGMCQDLTMPS